MSSSDMAAVRLLRLWHRDEQGGITSAVVAPQWGANVMGFSFKGGDWSWPLPILEAVDPSIAWASPSSYGIPLLAPTPGRVGPNQDGRFQYRGSRYSMRPSRHGLVRQAAWEVLSHSPAEVVCGLEVRGPEVHRGEEPKGDAFPFDFRAEHRITLEDRALRSQVRLENTGDTLQPLNVGWHPYLHRSGTCKVKIPAASRWELDGGREPVPTGAIVELSEQEDFSDGKILGPDDHWDDVFTDLTFEAGVATCWVEEEATVLTRSGDELELRVRRIVECPQGDPTHGSRPVRNVQLYTPKGRDAISIEPLSAPPDAINLLARGHDRSDVCELSPGESATFEITIRLDVLP